MKRKLGAILLVVALVLALALPMATVVGASPTTVTFDSGFSAGDSVEGLGTADTNLEITSTGDDLVIVEKNNNTYLAYSGNNVSQNDTPNGGLPGGFGFGDVDRDDELGFDVTFNGNTVSSFSIDMFDYGDWFNQMDNYSGTKTHTAKLVAYDNTDTEIDNDPLTFTSTGGGSTGRTMTTLNGVDIADKPLSSAGDALAAVAGDPGLWSFSVSGTGIFKVVMEFVGNDSIDPGVAWDNISFEIEEEPFVTNLCAGQDINIGNTIVENDGTYLYVTYEITVEGWLLVETHLEVIDDSVSFPTTKTGNPKVGHFTWSETHDPPVDTFTYTIPLVDIGDGVTADDPVFIAAHAEVIKVEGDCQDPFWATGWSDYNPGDEVDDDPIQYDNPDDMLGAPDAALNGTWTGFASLGFGGSVIIYFDDPIFNGPDDYDISVHEVTGTTPERRASYPEESVSVEVLFDGVWYPAGVVTNHDGGDGVGKISIPEDLMYVEAVKLTDTTNAENYPVPPHYIADAYDIDAVDACFLVVQEETAWGAGCDEGNKIPFNENGKGNWGVYFEYTIQ